MLTTCPLPYRKKDLAPVMSAKTLDYHFEHLAKNYAINYNTKKGDPRFNRAGNFLHNVFFAQFRRPREHNPPTPKILAFIKSHFGSFEEFKDAMKKEAMKIQGSGWIYLSTKGTIRVIHNHAVRNDIVLLVDWWEHAWALDYQSDKGKYFDNIWKIINWNVVTCTLAYKLRQLSYKGLRTE
jgi:Fe-Mn family superoxide dismutase